MLPYSQVWFDNRHTYLRQSTEPFLPNFTHFPRELFLLLASPEEYKKIGFLCIF